MPNKRSRRAFSSGQNAPKPQEQEVEVQMPPGQYETDQLLVTELKEKLQKLAVFAGVLITVCLAAVITMPGGYYEEMKTSVSEPSLLMQCKSSTLVHNIGEARVSESWKFVLFIYGTGYSFYICLSILIIHAASGKRIVSKWRFVYFVCKVALGLASIFTAVAVHCLYIIILGFHTSIALHMSGAAGCAAFLTVCIIFFMWY